MQICQLFVAFRTDALVCSLTENLPEPVKRFSELSWDSSQNLAIDTVLGSSLVRWEKKEPLLCYPRALFVLPTGQSRLMIDAEAEHFGLCLPSLPTVDRRPIGFPA